LTDTGPKTVAIIGGGPAGLMAAETIARGIDNSRVQVTIYEAMPSAGRKFLMAGRGGLNLTHGEDYATFVTRYGDAPPALRAALDAFPPDAVRAWCEGLGQETFVGSSGRVFPKAFKASPLLRAWLRRLDEAGVILETRHRWLGWSDGGAMRFATPDGEIEVKADAVVLACGGASWPKLGSDGAWADVLRAAKIDVAPLKPSNAGFTVAWSDVFRDRFAGQPLKRIAVRAGDDGDWVRGELMITRDGLEGGAIYALSGVLREAIEKDGAASITLALRPDLANEKLVQRLAQPRGKQSFSNFLRKALTLSPAEIGLLHEAALATGRKLAAFTPDELAAFLNTVPLRLTGSAGLSRAISTAGGVRFGDLTSELSLRAHENVFVAGEMLDLDAPTGGYLLTASLATGANAGRGAIKFLNR
jgi:uncharacterized flavoprotein (TIGR03862 family)